MARAHGRSNTQCARIDAITMTVTANAATAPADVMETESNGANRMKQDKSGVCTRYTG